jgi:hypothetical protein
MRRAIMTQLGCSKCRLVQDARVEFRCRGCGESQPVVRSQWVRRLVSIMQELEIAEPDPTFSGDYDRLPLKAVEQRRIELELAVKRIVQHPPHLWRDDPLIILRRSELSGTRS